MRVPILAVLPGQEPLRESALAFQQQRPAQFPITLATMPEGMQIDPTFPAIPVGTGRPEDAFMAQMDATTSQSFVVSGFVEVDSLEDVPKDKFSQPRIEPFMTCGGSPAVGDTSLVKTKLNVPKLAAKGLDGSGVAVAIMDTGINLAHLTSRLGASPQLDAANSWLPPGTATLPGKHPVDHGTMCAYDVLIAAPGATLLDFPVLGGTAPGATQASSLLSVAMIAYASLWASWAVAFSPGGAAKYKALVVSNSWGIFHPSSDLPAGHPGRFCDNPSHPFNVIVSALVNSGADIVFAAGNCGTQCPDGRCKGRTARTIMGTNAHDRVLTLAGCDTNDTRVGYSAPGPSIQGMFLQKPDLMAYTHFLGSEAFGANSPDLGTSAACPLAAGCIAAVRTKASRINIPPGNLFDQLRSTARPVGRQSGWNRNYGHGIIDPLAEVKSLGL